MLPLPGGRSRPLNGILGDDDDDAARTGAMDMLNNKNLSDLCRPELNIETRGERPEDARRNEIEKWPGDMRLDEYR